MGKNGSLDIMIYEILKNHSDYEHRLTKEDIRRLLEQEYSITADRKTVQRVLGDLAAFDDRIGYDTTTRTRRSKSEEEPHEEDVCTNYYYEAMFTYEELRYLMDAVTFSPHMPTGFRQEIRTKLKQLGTQHFKPREIIIRKPARKENPDLLHNVGLLSDAMEQNCKVQLKYLEYDENKQLVPRKNSKGLERVHTISPYQFAMSRGVYFLICNNDRFDGLAHYRVDRMRDIELLDQPRRDLSVSNLSRGDLDHEMRIYCEQHAFMYSGDPEHIELLLEPWTVNGVVEVFGEIVRFEKCDDGRLRADLRATRGSVLQLVRIYAPGIAVLSPEDLRAEVKELWSKALSHYGPDEEASE